MLAAVFLGLANAEMYCLNGQHDFTGGAKEFAWLENGWSITGDGGVSGKQAFNLLGGYVQFTIDTSRAQGGVNNNFYTSSPPRSLFPKYCDIQPNNSPQCMEMDIVENNGNCLSQTTWHTWPNKNGGCDEDGCWGQTYASGKRTMRASFSEDGWMTVTVNGKEVQVTHPTPSGNAMNYVKSQMQSKGVQFHSTQWVGWVPSGNCPGGENVDASTFTVTDVIVSGSIVQGPEATKCSSEFLGGLGLEASGFLRAAMASTA